MADPLRPPEAARPHDPEPGLALLHAALTQLSEPERREVWFILAMVLEGKLPEPVRAQICPALRLLATSPLAVHTGPEDEPDGDA